jgi:hypothetical protein
MSADGAAIFWMIGGATWRLRRSSALAWSPPSSRRNAQVSSERLRVVDDRNWQVFASPGYWMAEGRFVRGSGNRERRCRAWRGDGKMRSSQSRAQAQFGVLTRTSIGASSGRFECQSFMGSLSASGHSTSSHSSGCGVANFGSEAGRIREFGISWGLEFVHYHHPNIVHNALGIGPRTQSACSIFHFVIRIFSLR